MVLGFLWRLKIKHFTKNTYLANSVFSSDAIAITDERIAKKIQNYESDEEKIDAFRKAHSKNVLDLKRKMDSSSTRKFQLEGQIRSNAREYELLLKKELADIQKIIELTRKIIENEHLSILSDARKPMILLEQYKKTLKDSLKHVAIDDRTRVYVVNLLTEIDRNHEQVLRYLIDLCGQLKNAGLDGARDTSGLVNSLEERAAVKRKLGGRVLALQHSIRKLEAYFSELKRNKTLTDEEADSLLKNITQFKDTFNQLDEFIRNRSVASESLIKEAFLIQKRKLEELTVINTELKQFASALPIKSKPIITADEKIVNDLENEDTRDIRDETKMSSLLVNGLVSDESRLNSEGPVSKEQVGSKTILDKMRKNSLKFTFILLGTFATQLAAPAVQAIRYDDKDKIMLVGSPEHIEKYIEGQGNETISLNQIQAQTTKIVAIEKKFLIQEQSLSNFSLHFDNKEGMVDSNSFKNNLKKDINKDIQEAILVAKNQIYKELKGTNISKEDKDKLFNEASVSEVEFIPGESSIIGYACPLGSALGKTSSNNNLGLGGERAKQGFYFTSQVINELEKDSVIHFNVDSLSAINVGSGGAILKHAKVHVVVNTLNKYTKNVEPSLMSKFFADPMYSVYQEYNNKDKLQIDYAKLSAGDQTELLKFDLAARLMKFLDDAKYQKDVKTYLSELRKIELKLSFKVKIDVYGSNKELIIPLLPVGDLPVRQPIRNNQASDSNYFVPTKIGNTNSLKYGGFNKTYGIPRSEPSRNRTGRGANISGKR